MLDGPIIAGIIVLLFLLALPCAIEGAMWQGMSENGSEYKYLSPATLKRGTKMNWVGCVLTWIALGIISPCMFIYKCIYNEVTLVTNLLNYSFVFCAGFTFYYTYIHTVFYVVNTHKSTCTKLMYKVTNHIFNCQDIY